MSGDARFEGADASSRERTRTAMAILGIAVLCCLLALSLTAGVTAQENNESSDSGEPPAFGNATKGNLTTIHLTITDDTDVDEGTISASDFQLDTGTLEGISVNETGSDATVALYLHDIVSSDEVTVSLTGDGSIDDTAGNTLTEANATATGMDGYRPQLQDFSVERINDTAATVRVVSSESLSELYVGVGGPGSDTLTMANFTERDTPTSFEVPYEATVTFDEEGEYELLVGTMTDANGVTSRYRVERSFLVDRTPPTAAIGGPAGTSVGETVTFSGNRSTDDFGIASYDWSVDGNHTATGERLNHTFETPGYHGVTLTVTDRGNNTHNTTYPILVESEVTTDAVSVESRNRSVATASVGTNRTTGRVLIGKEGGLVSTGDVRLESLAVDVPSGSNASLEFAASANASAGFERVNTTTLAGLSVGHDRSLSTATFRFSVNRSRLDAADLSPRDVTLYRHTDGWRSVYTTKINETDGWVTYEATAAGLSEFAVAASGGDTADDEPSDDPQRDATRGEDPPSQAEEPTGTASIRVRNSTLLTDTVDPGDRILVRAVAYNAGNASGDYEVGLVVNDTAISRTTVTVPPGENRTITFAERVDAGGMVVVNGTIAGDLVVGGNHSAAAAAGGGGGIPIPNPLALWPGGLLGQALGAVFWFVVVLYVVLKGLALYLGY